MIEPIQTYKHKKKNIYLEIYKDETEFNDPRQWDNIGEMICFHSRYSIGDEHNLKYEDFETAEDLKKYLEKELNAYVILPLFLYDHSGLTISTDNTKYPFNCRWDSSFIGFIFTTKQKMKEEGINKKKAGEFLNQEIKVYDQYLRGEIYSFNLVERKKCKCCKQQIENLKDSCAGFFGDNWKENGLIDHAGINFKEFEKVTNG